MVVGGTVCHLDTRVVVRTAHLPARPGSELRKLGDSFRRSHLNYWPFYRPSQPAEHGLPIEINLRTDCHQTPACGSALCR